MRKRWSKRRREIGRALIIASIILSVVGMPALSKAEGALQLEVLLNGKPQASSARSCKTPRES
jgi:hypothetical protein